MIAVPFHCRVRLRVIVVLTGLRPGPASVTAITKNVNVTVGGVAVAAIPLGPGLSGAVAAREAEPQLESTSCISATSSGRDPS